MDSRWADEVWPDEDTSLHLGAAPRVLVEDEARHVGRVLLPKELWQRVKRAPVALLESADEAFYLPMSGFTQSFNVGVALGIRCGLLYRRLRRR